MGNEAATTDENGESLRAGNSTILMLCAAAAFVPGLGHALQRKWDRAAVFFSCIAIMVLLGINLDGSVVEPTLEGFFSAAKFLAQAGAGLLYWIPWLAGIGIGEQTSQTYDYANIFLYVAGLLNMLIIVDVFDIAMGRKQ
ncbi:MAG TPA: DUF6677 family protein [Acidobacteriota bacterium]|nr:DUF6677 family protein [Acidobacteriota bacterium]